MKLSDYVIDFVVNKGVGHVFEIAGGAITHLLDSTYDRNDIECISMHHEQAGSFAAEAYARVNGKLGVAMATSGPGALNMVTGIGSCYFDSVPCLFITGQVNTYEYKFDRPQRQIGFQETDIVSVVKPLTKYAAMVVDAEQIRYELEKAVFLAQSGRPGPVLLDLPMNIQRAEIDPDTLPDFFNSAEYKDDFGTSAPFDESALDTVVEIMLSAKRPVILVGGGVRTSGANAELAELVDKTGIPVVSSLMGLDAFSHDDPAFVGMIGAYGNRYANLTLANADFLLVLGSRLDTRQTGTRPETFARKARKVHVDIDPVELNAKLPADMTFNCDALVFLQKLNRRLGKHAVNDVSSWRETIAGYRNRYAVEIAEEECRGIDPNVFMGLLSEFSTTGDVICLDVGQNQMWAAQSYRLRKGQRMLIAGGMGAMGFALPAGIGAVMVAPGNRAIVIAGDGGIQINIQELDTIAKHRLPVKIFIMNNGCLGMVRQFQDMYFEGRRQSTVKGYNCPDLIAIAEAYGIPTRTIKTHDEAEAITSEVMGNGEPMLVDVKIDQASCVNPKLEFNKPIEDMSPYLSKEELDANMDNGLAEE